MLGHGHINEYAFNYLKLYQLIYRTSIAIVLGDYYADFLCHCYPSLSHSKFEYIGFTLSVCLSDRSENLYTHYLPSDRRCASGMFILIEYFFFILQGFFLFLDLQIFYE